MIVIEASILAADFAHLGEQAREADGRGMPGTEVMKAYLRAVDATGYEWPYVYSID